MKERVVKNWQTSLLAVALLIVALVMVWFGKISWEAFTAFLPSVFGLLWVKDSFLKSLFGKDQGKTCILIGLLGLMGLMSTGCYTKKQWERMFPPKVTVHDSIHTEYCETVRDTTITLPADSSWLRAWLKCDSAGNVYVDHSSLRQAQGTSVDWILQDNVLYINFQKDAYELRLQLKDKLIKYYRDKQTTIEHTTNILNPWQKTLLWVAGVIVILSIVTIIIILKWKKK